MMMSTQTAIYVYEHCNFTLEKYFVCYERRLMSKNVCLKGVRKCIIFARTLTVLRRLVRRVCTIYF